ncbi:hypothetical protein [Micromonospora inyonensis]|uniref:Uncharacterized protein n=1 Tax=Micromonospora inyonensis TaxID=47866 RepID=A0A1C6RQD3_9ACTN|nr:hypothetical protein [Micromonospora inyonensis]SCL19362.1 hypothetical protein GA0074694_2659 [Micromonospora inyonensis]
MKSVKTVLGFLTVALLVMEGIALVLVTSVVDADRALIWVLVVLILIVFILFGLAIARPGLINPAYQAPAKVHPVPVASPPRLRYDIFVSSPMTAFGADGGYEEHRKEVLKIVAVIERRCQLRCYYSGRTRETLQDLEAVDVGLRNDMEALRSSRTFVLILPEAFVSSVFVEAGMALAFGKPAVYFRRPDVRLPFMLEGAANAAGSDLPPTRQYPYQSTPDLIRLIQNNGRRIFDP